MFIKLLSLFFIKKTQRSLFPKRSTRGFTLLEIAVVVGVIGILAGLAVASGEALVPNVRTRAAAQAFAKNVDKMRMTALRNNRETKLCMDTYDSSPATITSANQGKYIMYVGNKSANSATWDQMPGDLYDNDSDDDASEAIVDIGKGGLEFIPKVSIGDWGSSIGGPYYGNGDCIVFSPRGWVVNPASDFNAQGFIEITFVNKMARHEGLNHDYIVMIARSGMTRIDNQKARLNDQFFSGTSYDSSAN